MKTYKLNDLSSTEIKSLYKRSSINLEETIEVVKPILAEVKKNGLEAALKYAKNFDQFAGENFIVTKEEFEKAEDNLSESVKTALRIAAKNIEAFHKEQLPKSYEVETMPGVKCSREFRAIENVGLYIPGGNAVLPSTMMMLGIPAKLAGCKRIVACSPSKNNKVNDEVLYCAKLAGVTEFYKIGGAQAIALLAYGDNQLKKVDKIFGPGNQFVTAAKLLVSIDAEGCAIDMPAGPSEVLIIADEFANPEYIAADLLSQAEHGADSQVVLISISEKLIVAVKVELEKQLSVLPRKEFAEKSLQSSFAILADNQIGRAHV